MQSRSPSSWGGQKPQGCITVHAFLQHSDARLLPTPVGYPSFWLVHRLHRAGRHVGKARQDHGSRGWAVALAWAVWSSTVLLNAMHQLHDGLVPHL